ncbi:MAG: outer membrane beta-barrel protein [Crocinitomicaceae bacterium]|nr:outer membrane beta-barrel protein [Crocinitomicaceae bacterium]
MKKSHIIVTALLFSVSAFGQVEEPTEPVEEVVAEATEGEGVQPGDTTRMNLRLKQVIIVNHRAELEQNGFYVAEDGDTIYKRKKRNHEAHWAGLDFGFTMLMDDGFENKFTNNPYWKNDPAKSQVWNINFLEYKFDIAREYFGFTTGLGLSFASISFNDNYVLMETPDTLFAEIDSVYTYTKNKLKASYLTIPLLFEINTNARASKSFYFAFGVIGGVRMTSRVKRKGEFDGRKFTQSENGRWGLNAFKLDGAVRFGYGDWGAFVTYGILPLFDSGKTIPIHPLSFGLSFNIN